MGTTGLISIKGRPAIPYINHARKLTEERRNSPPIRHKTYTSAAVAFATFACKSFAFQSNAFEVAIS